MTVQQRLELQARAAGVTLKQLQEGMVRAAKAGAFDAPALSEMREVVCDLKKYRRQVFEAGTALMNHTIGLNTDSIYKSVLDEVAQADLLIKHFSDVLEAATTHTAFKTRSRRR